MKARRLYVYNFYVPMQVNRSPYVCHSVLPHALQILYSLYFLFPSAPSFLLMFCKPIQLKLYIFKLTFPRHSLLRSIYHPLTLARMYGFINIFEHENRRQL